MELDELKPCPFCGTTPEIRADELFLTSKEDVCFRVDIKCRQCGISKGSVTRMAIDKFNNQVTVKENGIEKAISYWNRRTEAQS